MDINANDIHAIAERLRAAINEGYDLVAYNVELGFANKNDLYFFRDKESFEQFSKVHNTEHALFFEYDIKRVLNSVVAIIENKVDFSSNDSFHYRDGVYSIYDPMQTENLESLKHQLKGLGFHERLFPALDYYIEYPQPQFNLLQRERTENEKSLCYLHFVREPGPLDYRFMGYEATLRIAPEIPNIRFHGISATDLDESMKEIDWSIDHHKESLVEEYISTREGTDFLDKLDKILRDLDGLYKSGDLGKDAVERLMFKYWYGEPWEPTEISLEHVRRIYEWKESVDLIATPAQSLPETCQVLKSNSIACLATMPLTMDELDRCAVIDQTNTPLEAAAGIELRILARHFELINSRCLEIAVGKIGFDEPVQHLFQSHIENRPSAFDIVISKEVDADKVRSLLHFEEGGNGWFLFKHYDVTLYHQVAVSHELINGIYTRDLEESMKKADWYYEYSESAYAWDKGFAEIRKITDALNSLCKDEAGRLIATQLWNNHVPLFTVSKPGLIRKYEEENHLYPAMRFSADTHVNAAHIQLKNMVIKSELHHHEINSLAKEETSGQQITTAVKQEHYNVLAQKDNSKQQLRHRHRINKQ